MSDKNDSDNTQAKRGCPLPDCQAPLVTSGAAELILSDKLRHIALRLISAAERRIAVLRAAWSRWRRLGRNGNPSEATSLVEEQGASPRRAGGPFKAGEIVEVLDYREIAKTLDQNGVSDGLNFMEGMRRFCGRRLTVRKKVRTIFDERTRRMVKISKDRYILDNAICDGKGQYDREGCDRCCFYFWSDQWLRKPS
jgi:hypothetical protein